MIKEASRRRTLSMQSADGPGAEQSE
jgi:hypothetical protein